MDRTNHIAFDTVADPHGIEIVDCVEQLRYQFHTPAPVSATPISTDSFLFPVEKGFTVETSELVLPSVVSVIVRDGDGDMVTEIEHLESESFDSGSYILDLSPQIKTFLEFEGPVDVSIDLLQVRIEFDSDTEIDIGVRSRHTRPAATVTTTTDPIDMMQAVSTFGSALKSTSPERSFPTLRGHPPEVELGSSLSIPAGLSRPETGIRLAVPPRLDAIYPVAPLAYYLGAEVVPSSTPRMTTESGFEYSFSYPGGFEDDVAHTFKQLFLLDCITRTEGFYEIDLHERNALARNVDLDWARLYDLPIAKRLEPYLSVPYSVLEEHVPEWRLTVHVEAMADTIEQLPYVIDDLAIIRTTQTDSPASLETVSTNSDGGELLTRSSAADTATLTRSSADPLANETFVEPRSMDSLEQAWIGDDIPIGASKLTHEAFQNRLDRERTAGDISITIVLNDQRMAEERDLITEAYGDREDLPFDISVYRDLSVDELRDRLAEERSFLHYIGHIDHEGLECSDGKLDVGTVDDTGIDAFLLNACNSYRQGLHLIEAGAIGGIVTLTEIINDSAVAIGELIARLLNAGFPLRAALTIAREENVLGGQYIVVGDGGMTVTQSPSRTPNLLEISSEQAGYEVAIRTFSTDTAGLGTIYIPYIGDNSEYFLSSGEIGPFHVSKADLLEFLDMENVPVTVDGTQLRWSASLSGEDLE